MTPLVDQGRHRLGPQPDKVARHDQNMSRGRPPQHRGHSRQRASTGPFVGDCHQAKASTRSPADRYHRVDTGGASAVGNPPSQRNSVDLSQRLVRTESTGRPADQDRATQTQAGGHAGSSCRRNIEQRSASLVSPSSPAVRASPARAARKPRLVWCSHRTNPEPRQPD